VCSLLAVKADDIQTALVAWLAYIVGFIAKVSTRDKGHYAGEKVRGDLPDHNEWKEGIDRALRFMRDRKKCPTHAPLISAIQKKKSGKK
jgi:hypothetical protein